MASLVGVSVVWAQDIRFEATVSSAKVAMNDVLQLTLTVAGAKDNIDPIDVGAIDGFDARFLGPSTNVSIVNGNYSSERSFIYNLLPTKSGHFSIPSFSVTIGGQKYTTQPIDVDVVADAQASLAAAPAAAAAGQGEEDRLKDKMFISVSVPQKTVFVGQKVPVTIKLLVHDTPIRDIQFPAFSSSSGIVVDGFTERPAQYGQVINGLQYSVVEFKTSLCPTVTGPVSVGQVSVQGNLVYRNPQKQNTGGPGFFNDEFFSNFFESVRTRPVTISSTALRLNVLPLPEEGKPEGFSGAVGQFDFEASVAPVQVQTGDPVTLRMKLTGDGNLKSIDLPRFEDGRFKTYDPTIKDEAGGKALEQVIIPSSKDITEAAPIRFSFFDPVAKEYKTITRGPFALKVTPPAAGSEFKAVGFDLTTAQNVSPPPSFAHFDPMDHIRQAVAWVAKILKNVRFWLALALIGLCVGTAALWRNFRRRLKDDTRFSRRFFALKKAQKTLSSAEARLEAADAQGFYGFLYKALNTYLADKFHKPSGTSVLDEVKGQLEKAIGQDSVRVLKDIYDACDLVRFAATNPDPSHMNQHLAKAREVIALLEKKL